MSERNGESLTAVTFHGQDIKAQLFPFSFLKPI